MRISAVWHLAVLVALAALMAMAGTAHSSEIADLYSSIDSADVTLEGDVAGMALRLDLIDEGRLISDQEPDAGWCGDLCHSLACPKSRERQL